MLIDIIYICLLLIDNEEFIVVFGEIIKGKGTF